MGPARFIGMRYLRVGDCNVPVVLRRNAGGSVAGQCLLDHAERPIIDAPSVEEVLARIEDVLEALLLARGRLF
jgi:hypothetical protein